MARSGKIMILVLLGMNGLAAGQDRSEKIGDTNYVYFKNGCLKEKTYYRKAVQPAPVMFWAGFDITYYENSCNRVWYERRWDSTSQGRTAHRKIYDRSGKLLVDKHNEDNWQNDSVHTDSSLIIFKHGEKIYESMKNVKGKPVSDEEKSLLCQVIHPCPTNIKVNSIEISSNNGRGYWKYHTYSNGWVRSDWMNDSGRTAPYSLASKKMDTLIQYGDDRTRREEYIVFSQYRKRTPESSDTLVYVKKNIRTYYPNGKIRTEGFLRDYNPINTLWGYIRIGTWTEYHETGEIKLVSKHKDGIVHNSLFGSMNMTPKKIRGTINKGTWKAYYPNGKIKGKYWLVHNKIIRLKEYDESGKIKNRCWFPSPDKVNMDNNKGRSIRTRL